MTQDTIYWLLIKYNSQHNQTWSLRIFTIITLSIWIDRPKKTVGPKKASDQGLHNLSPIQQFLDTSTSRKIQFNWLKKIVADDTLNLFFIILLRKSELAFHVNHLLGRCRQMINAKCQAFFSDKIQKKKKLKCHLLKLWLLCRKYCS